MDGHAVSQLMVSQQLLDKGVFMAASSCYQKTCLILQQMRLMDMQTLQLFAKLLLTDNSLEYIGNMLIDGE